MAIIIGESNMKFDMGAAWNTATSLIGRNRDMILVVAGAFFFLPYLAATLLMPEAMSPQPANPEDMQAMMDSIMQNYADYWWAMLIIFVMQGIGTLALLVLLTDRARPTLGDALKSGAKAFPSYFATNILAGLGIVGAVGIVALPASLLSAASGPAAAVLAGFVMIPLIFYLMIKFSLIMPAIAIDGILNPFAAIARSWRLTKGNSFRLFLFFVLLFVAIVVVSVLATMVLGVVFAAIGGETELIGNGIVASLVNAVFAVIFLAVLAGVHQQLVGNRPKAPGEVIE